MQQERADQNTYLGVVKFKKTYIWWLYRYYYGKRKKSSARSMIFTFIFSIKYKKGLWICFTELSLANEEQKKS